MIEVITLFIALIGSAAFAYFKGDWPERLGAVWLLLNAAIQWLVTTFLHDNATLHLLIDGVYAIGLLPLAFFYVSWWIGIQTFIAAAGFGLEAFYLLNDKPVDYQFLALSNWLFAAGLFNLLVATTCTTWQRRRTSRLQAPKLAMA